MATMKDIAEKAGVSIGTVDRVLHNRGRFSEDTAKAVRAAVEELEYRPNVMARNLSTSKKCELAVLSPFPEQDSGYWALSLEGMQQAYENMKIYGMTMEVFHFDRYKPSTFDSASAELLKKDYDGYLIAPLIEAPLRSLLEVLPADSPVLFFDTDLSGTRRKAFIGQNSRLSGRLAARLMLMLSGDCKGEYLIIGPDTENIHLRARIDGFSEKINRKVKVMKTIIEAEKRRELFYERLDDAFSGSVAGIYVVDASAHYTADYLTEKGLKVPLIGNDLVEENKKGLLDGMIDFILTQRPQEQGYNGIRLLYRYLMLDEAVPDELVMPIDIITAENLQR